MLINYIPEFLRDVNQFQEIFNSLDIQIDKIYDFQQEILAGQFIYYCDEKFISKFEELLSIIPKNNESLEHRRNKIILKFNEKLPYTMFRLYESLDKICGKGKYFVFVIYDEYFIGLRILNEISEVYSLAERMIPANMKVNVFEFNIHRIIGNFTHRYLKKYTHREIYKNIL